MSKRTVKRKLRAKKKANTAKSRTAGAANPVSVTAHRPTRSPVPLEPGPTRRSVADQSVDADIEQLAHFVDIVDRPHVHGDVRGVRRLDEPLVDHGHAVEGRRYLEDRDGGTLDTPSSMEK